MAEHSHTIQAPDFVMIISVNQCVPSLQRTAPCCNAPRHVATQSAMLQPSLQRTAPCCNAKRHVATVPATHRTMLQRNALCCNRPCNAPHHVATQRAMLQSSLQRNAPCCNAARHVAIVPATQRAMLQSSLQRTAPCCSAAMLQRSTPSCNAAHPLVRSAPFVALPSRRGVRCMRTACAGAFCVRRTRPPMAKQAALTTRAVRSSQCARVARI